MSGLPEFPPARGMVLMHGAMTYVYPADQLREYGALCRKQALEEAASLCDSLGGDIDERDPDESKLCANSLARAIRGLK